jgi:hypothetical protein
MLIEGWMGTEEGGLVKTFACDFSKWTSERLRRELIFHENDRGTENVDEEYRRMFLVHKITAELQRRGEHVEMFCP